MTNPYHLTGGELTALTMVHWTSNPPLNAGHVSWLGSALQTLCEKELVLFLTVPNEGWWLTSKGKCLMDAINSIPEPVNQWVIP